MAPYLVSSGADGDYSVARLFDGRDHIFAAALGQVVREESAVADDHAECNRTGLAVVHFVIPSLFTRKYIQCDECRSHHAGPEDGTLPDGQMAFRRDLGAAEDQVGQFRFRLRAWSSG